MVLNELLDDEDIPKGKSRTRLTLPSDIKRGLERLSEERHGNQQYQGAIVTEALRFYFDHLNEESYTLNNGSTTNIDGEYSVMVDNGDVIQIEHPDKIDVSRLISESPPDTYKKRLPLIAAVLRNEYTGYVSREELESLAQIGFRDKTARTQERYIDELVSLSNPYEKPFDISVPNLWTPFQSEYETYLDTNGLIVGDEDVVTAYHRTEIDWQLKQIDDILDKRFTSNEKTDSMFSVIDCIYKHLEALDIGESLREYIEQEKQVRVNYIK